MSANGIDLSSPDFLADPYPTYRKLREASPPFWLAHDGPSRGMWLKRHKSRNWEAPEAT